MTASADQYQTIADLASRGQLSSAEQHCRQMLQETNDPELIYMPAVIEGRQKRYPSALALFEKATRYLQ